MRLTARSLQMLVSAFVVLLSLAWAPASAQTPNPGLGPLTQYLPATGQDETWRFVNANNSFEIQNVGDPNAIKYFFVGPKEGTEGRRIIEAAVSIHPDTPGSAGLLYGLDREKGVYHVLSLDAAGMVRLFRRDATGFRPMLEQSSDAFQQGKMNTLRIEENGNEIAFSLNGRALGSVGGDLFGFGGAGLAAVGNVRAFFNMFSDGF